ncbi:MAG: four helix bundle protein [Actinomycetota bacterium]
MVTSVYKLTGSFPEDEKFGITSQMRRAALSIPLNIVEGNGRITKGEYRQFLGQARGSLSNSNIYWNYAAN